MLDQDPLPFRAARGLVKHAYRTAAEVSGVLVAIDRTTKNGAGLLTGTIVTSDPYLLTQAGLVFVVPNARVWRWPIESVQVTPDGRLMARLGKLEGM